MKFNWNRCLVTLAIMVFVGAVVSTRAQEKQAASQEAKKSETTLKVTVVVTELDGAKKVSSLPYAFYVNVDDTSHHPTSSVRMGLRVPVATGVFSNNTNQPTQFQYMDIGTNLDCAANSTSDSRYKLILSVDRTSLSTPEDKKSTAATEGLNISTANPIVQHFSSSYNLMIRDGQTIEATSTSDPISGHVLQISVTTNVVK
jgi:hypothetical protein